jgi:16S rRNA (adenine1518-N6/adenine1519-N6)-dimethyltransferase
MSTPESSPRQTLSYLQQQFQARGLRPKTKLGQNFLIDLNLLDIVVQAANLSPVDLVLEIGTGAGSLTAKLSDQAGAVLSVEIDKDLHDLARELLAGRSNISLLHADILANKNRLNPAVLSALDDWQRKITGARLKLVANLPYVVATPALTNFLQSDISFERMVVMVQWEIAEKLIAKPGGDDYGALGVFVQSVADVETVRRRIPPAVFWPRPEVDSALVIIRPSPVKRVHVGDVQRFRIFLRDLYSQRRKNLRGALAGLPSRNLAKAEVDRRLAQIHVDGAARAEDLDIETHLRLCAAFG